MYSLKKLNFFHECCVTHLGNSFGLNADQIMIDKSVFSFIQKFNYLMASFRYYDTKTKYRLFKTLCMSLDALSGVCQINILRDSL